MGGYRQCECQLVTGLESPLIYNELHERIALAMRSIMPIGRIGTFFAVVIETLESKHISKTIVRTKTKS
jgi:hypothetical protein